MRIRRTTVVAVACVVVPLLGCMNQDLIAETNIPSDTDDGGTDETCPEIAQEPCVRAVSAGSEAAVPDGLAWCTAFPTVQQGIDAAFAAAAEGGGICQVWVGAGAYSLYDDGIVNEIQLRTGVEVYGGFIGDELVFDPDARDLAANESILDGSHPDDVINVYNHVIIGADGAVLDGFVVTGGNAVGGSGGDIGEETTEVCGGGMFNNGVSPVVRNCRFMYNAALWGGGVCNRNAAPEFINCSFWNNAAGPGYGGGMINYESSPTLDRCVFVENMVDVFVGEGLVNWSNSSPSITNCIFANDDLANLYSSSPVVTGCTFTRASMIPAPLHSLVSLAGSQPQVANSIFWDFDEAEEGSPPIAAYPLTDELDPMSWNTTAPYEIDVHNSLVEGGYAGSGNFDEYPGFESDESAIYLTLAAGSPCIDAADGDAAPPTDYAGNPRVDDPATENTGVGEPAYADVGAYEFQP